MKLYIGRYFLVFAAALTLMAGCKGGDTGKPKHVRQQADTLYTLSAAMLIYGDQPERALLIVDSAEIVGNISEYRAELTRAKIYGRSDEKSQQNLARDIGESLLESDSVEANIDNRLEVIDLLINVSRLRQDYEQWLHWATEKAELCRSKSDEVEALRTEAEIGLVLSHLGQREEGLKKLDMVIQRLDGVRRFSEMDACIIALKRKIHVLSSSDRYAEVIPSGMRIIEKLDDYEQHPADYSDNSFRQPDDVEQLTKYCDFYRSQAIGFLAGAYAKTGDKAQARHYCRQFEQSCYGQSSNGRKIISTVWCELGEYDKMSAIYEEMYRQMDGDTLNAEYATILRGHAIANQAQGNLAASNDYWQRYATLSQMLNDSLLVSKAHDYAARYHAQEQQIEIEREKAQAWRNGILAAGCSLIAMLIFGFAIWMSRQKRTLNQQNRILASQISGAIEYKKKYEELTAADVEQPVNDMPSDLGSLSDAELYKYLSNDILHNRLYLTPDFGRQSVMDRYNLTDRRVGAAFAQGSHYNSLPDFVRDCRLNYACQLLKEQPDMPIGDVALSAGFTTYATFSRDFKTKFGISPSFFRSQQ